MNFTWRTFRLFGIAAISGLFLIGLGSNSNSSAPAGYTGSPADGKTCGTNGGCHGGGTTTDNGMISTDIPSEGYTPGNEYTVTVTVAQAGVSKFGFSFSAQKDDGTQLGSLTAGTETNIVSSKYMSHKPSSTSGSDQKAWTFKWTAPSSGTGDVSFYAAGNASDNMSNATGDNIYVAKAVVNEIGADTSTTAIIEKKKSGISIYPNPAQSNVWIDLEHSETLSIINLSGKVVKKIEASPGKNKVDITDLDFGVYQVVNANRSMNETLVRL